MKTETRQFKMHEKLLFDVIQRQAGTLSKGILEGVMNSIDAGASAICISAQSERVVISDDGKGFSSRLEIEKFFETFGQPHEECENKRYGTFRMGRGQLISHGHNVWRTGAFKMEVDIKSRGLDYSFTDNLPLSSGCSISIQLYSPLSSLRLRELEDELKRAVKWATVPIDFNGDIISRDPAKGEWDLEDEGGPTTLSRIPGHCPCTISASSPAVTDPTPMASLERLYPSSSSN